MSQGRPAKCTGITARVRGVIARSKAAGSRQPVSGSQSAKTGTWPAWMTALAVAAKVIGDVTTSAPGSRSSASNARCNAAVHEETATAAGAST